MDLLPTHDFVTSYIQKILFIWLMQIFSMLTHLIIKYQRTPLFISPSISEQSELKETIRLTVELGASSNSKFCFKNLYYWQQILLSCFLWSDKLTLITLEKISIKNQSLHDYSFIHFKLKRSSMKKLASLACSSNSNEFLSSTITVFYIYLPFHHIEY